MLMTRAARSLYWLSKKANTLRLRIPDDDTDGEEFDDFTFNQIDILTDKPVTSTEQEIFITVKHCIHDTDHSVVYIGELDGSHVVLKCCYNTKYRRDFWLEARAYKIRMEELQGTVVPVCFGYYLNTEDLYGPYSLILLEYCGERIEYEFEDLELKERLEILNLLGRFHKKARLHPTDFAERNVVVRNGKYRLIDFHEFKGHKCEWTEDQDWRPGEFVLDVQADFPCSVLAEMADEHMGIWNTHKVPYARLGKIKLRSDEYPSQDVIDKLMPLNFIGVLVNWEWAEAYLKNIKKEIDSDPINFNLGEKIATRPYPPYPPYDPDLRQFIRNGRPWHWLYNE